mmetsp:Transcript_53064/g.158806  ORF Transcript_53064/g.158806 Transcript_53064/m.158806 type:complete len:226 (-) Transcript_53064:446-1123(-)
MTAAALVDHSAAIGQYFGSIRIPAAFLAGASFGAMWGKASHYDGDKVITAKEWLATIYHVLVTSSFVLALTTVVVATAAATKNLHGSYDPLASSGYMLLKREFEYEFILTRWSFFVSLFCFIIGVTCRVVVEFDLLAMTGEHRQRRRELGLALMCLMSGLIFHLLSFINTTLFCWNNLFGMTLSLIRLMVGGISKDRPLMGLSVALFFASFAFLAKSAIGRSEEE